MTDITHIIPLLKLDIYTVGSLKHAAIIDEDVEMVDDG